jgi:hypothetical protein
VFVIPSKFVQNISPIFECVDALAQFHPTEKVLVVDSYSEDVSYLQKLVERNNVIISKYKNKHYECGALYYAYEEFPNERYYALIQDSIILKTNWDEFLNDEITYNLMYFRERGNFGEAEYDYLKKVIAETEYKQHANNGHSGIYGMLGVYKKDVIEVFSKKGLLIASLPSNKFEAQMTERIFGICLTQDGHDITKNTIEGDYLSKTGAVDNNQLKYFKKIYGGRQ